MIHLNEEWARHDDLMVRVQGLVNPEMYATLTIGNFLDHKKDVETTGLIKSMLWLYTGINYYQRTCITFKDIFFHRVNQFEVQLGDRSSTTLNLPIFNPGHLNAIIQQEGIVDGDKISEAHVLYIKSNDYGCLVNLKKRSDQAWKERVKHPIFSPDLIPSI